jgi:hemin uptake protein HemP
MNAIDAGKNSPSSVAQNLPKAAGAGASNVREIDSSALFGPQQNILHIRHAGTRYVLRVTRENKLILTK